MTQRHYNPLDRLLINLDTGLRTIFGGVHTTGRANPAKNLEEPDLNKNEKDRLPKVRAQMEQAALEENDHLDWCEKRAKELGKNTSLLDPFWYLGSVAIGAAAGIAGDKWSLGFVAETERQVVKHLDSHLHHLPEHDKKTRAILQQMKSDEAQHATSATKSGGAELPAPVKKAMQLASKVMTKTAYWI